MALDLTQWLILGLATIQLVMDVTVLSTLVFFYRTYQQDKKDYEKHWGALFETLLNFKAAIERGIGPTADVAGDIWRKVSPAVSAWADNLAKSFQAPTPNTAGRSSAEMAEAQAESANGSARGVSAEEAVQIVAAKKSGVSK